MDSVTQDLIGPVDLVRASDVLDHVQGGPFEKFYRKTLHKTRVTLDGYLRALRKLPNNAERGTLLAGYDKSIQSALRELLEQEGLL